MNTYKKQQELLQAKNINLVYGSNLVLRDVSFTIKNIVRPGMTQGQVVSLIGRSGVGKTQLFKVLSGLQQPTSGQMTINGNRQVQAGDMGVVFQNYYLFEWRTIYQSLFLSARQNKKLKGHEKEAIEQGAAEFGLTDVLALYPQQASGGQQQRASILQQLLKDADFLLLDEPFSGLDACVIDTVTELLLQVSVSNELKTIIIISHDIAASTAISDTVFILGKEEGKPGATVKKEIDLIERELAWHKDIRKQPAFIDTVEEIKDCL